ncbi:alpha/beta fold hydrolase [Microbulbifer sp. VTAC004]|uniref:alpha/beta fold hydrolase n=1 Tax=Microbulbifer sp. VTAC004 TaxID=3243386 RepID=UPI00403920AF
MKPPSFYIFISILIFNTLVHAYAQAPVNNQIKPQDALLSDYKYPYPVKVFQQTWQNQPVSLAYMDVPAFGKRAQRGTVLLLHGKNFSGAYWEDTIDALSQLGYRVVAPDQIGFGKSSKPLRQYTLHSMSADTKALLDHLRITEVALVGHSMGGMLAVRFALMYPQVAQKLALINPIGLEDWKRVVPYEPLQKAIAREQAQTPESIQRYMSNAYFAGEWQARYTPLLGIQAGWTLGPDAAHMGMIDALTSEMVFTQPVLYEFSDLKVPTLLIIGTRDRTAIGRNRAPAALQSSLGRYDQLGRQAAEAIPNAKLVELTNVGHIPQYEAFPAYFDALSHFLQKENLHSARGKPNKHTGK